MPLGDNYKSAEEFIAKLDAGGLDADLHMEIGKLTVVQRTEVGRILMERAEDRSGPNGTD